MVSRDSEYRTDSIRVPDKRFNILLKILDFEGIHQKEYDDTPTLLPSHPHLFPFIFMTEYRYQNDVLR